MQVGAPMCLKVVRFEGKRCGSNASNITEHTEVASVRLHAAVVVVEYVHVAEDGGNVTGFEITTESRAKGTEFLEGSHEVAYDRCRRVLGQPGSEIRVVDHGRGDWRSQGRYGTKRTRANKDQEGEDGEVEGERERADWREHLGGDVDGEEQDQLVEE